MAPLGDGDLSAPYHQRGGRVPAHEREARPALAVLDRFQKKGRLIAGDTGERRNRGGEIGEDLPPDRNNGVVAGELAELVAAGLDHPKAR